jgi:hypothetical protein
LVPGGVFAPEPKLPLAGARDLQVIDPIDAHAGACVVEAGGAGSRAEAIVSSDNRSAVALRWVGPGEVEAVLVSPALPAFDT